MLGPESWSIPERYMVRYHLSQLVWWSLGATALLIAAMAAALAMTRVGLPRPPLVGVTWWYGVLVVTPALTAASFPLKPHLLRKVMPDWTLYRTVSHYKRAHVLVMAVCLVAGILPSGLAALTARFDHAVLVALLPVIALLFHFPHSEKFAAFVDEVLAERATAHSPDR